MVCKRGATWPMHSAGSLGGCEEGEVEHGGLRMVRSSIRLLFLNLDPLQNSAIVTSHCVQ